MGQPAWVNDDATRPASVLLNGVDEDPFTIRLKDPHFHSEPGCFSAEFVVDLLQGLFSVELRLTKSDEV